MIRCIIIEDQPPAQRVLQKYIGDIDYMELKGVFSDALQAIQFLKTNKVDLMFLDIHLPKLSGIEFMKTMTYKPDIVLTTAFPDYALESYDYGVIDYLLKPFSFERFVKAVSKVTSKKMNDQNETTIADQSSREEIFIKSGYEHVKVSVNDIIFIKSDADYTEIITIEKKHLSSEPLRFWTENLPTTKFPRIHKSYIVNTSKIEKVMGNQVTLAGEIKIPIGRAYKDHFMKSLLN